MLIGVWRSRRERAPRCVRCRVRFRRSAAGPRAGSARDRRRAAARRRAAPRIRIRQAPPGASRSTPAASLASVRSGCRAACSAAIAGSSDSESCAAGGSTTISWTSTQPATSSGQEICASASDSSPSGSASWAIGVYTAGPSDDARFGWAASRSAVFTRANSCGGASQPAVPANSSTSATANARSGSSHHCGALTPMIFARGRRRPDPSRWPPTAGRNHGSGAVGRAGGRRPFRLLAPVVLHTAAVVSIQRSGSDRARWAGNLWAVLTVDGAGQLTIRPRMMSRGAVGSPCGRTCNRVST